MKIIYFARHGETQANYDGYVPSKEEPLNAHGFSQAEHLAERAKHLSFDVLVSSDFLRAKQTIAPIVVANPETPYVIEPSVGEVLEASSFHGVQESEAHIQEARLRRNSYPEDADWRYEDGENYTDVFARIKTAKSFFETCEYKKIFVTSHSFYMMLFAASVLLEKDSPDTSWLACARKLHISNGGISVFQVTPENVWSIVTWNDHAHFAE